MRQLVRQHLRFFLFATLAALGLRLFLLFRFPALTNDSFVYGDIAKNWLQHGIYGLSGDEISPTYIRLPGYPAFLAAVFAVFGMEHYRAVMALQVLVDIATCFVIADMARRLVSARVAKAAFLLAALCPFLASYAAAALTETLEIFFTALAFDFAIVGLETLEQKRLRPWLGCGLAIGAAILLRPDGGLILVAIELYLAVRWVRAWRDDARASHPRPHSPAHLMRVGLILALVSLAPLVPWTWRNLHTMHRFQPLAPRYANEEDEFVPAGFNRWVKTWMADYASVEEVYWRVSGGTVDAGQLPSRAFDSEAQRQETEQLLADYNQVLHVTPEMDARFAALAAQRIRHAPLRYYLGLPLLRIADMWLRPRTETFPSDTRWWEFNDDPRWSALAVALGIIGLVYVALAAAGLAKARHLPFMGLLLGFVALRSIFLGTLENPEPRYTLECYPVVIILAAIFLRSQTKQPH
ncbi:MAG TPA: glycosyltransferase family 39 protein [Terriglobales bacterium]|nr:glycosyltransferase family 39 protein [Terriglobales bacterium]